MPSTDMEEVAPTLAGSQELDKKNKKGEASRTDNPYLARSYLTEQLASLPISKLYPQLCERILDIICIKWKDRFSHSVWNKFLKKTHSPRPRIIKEVNEIAPVLDRVMRFIEENIDKPLNSEVEKTDKRFTVVDLGSGLGFMGLLLAELVPDADRKLKEIYLVDKMWRKSASKDATNEYDNDHMSADHIIQAKEFLPVPLLTLQLDLKTGRDLADLRHFIFENGTKENRGKGNIANYCSTSQKSDGGAEILIAKNPTNEKNRVILLGVHLCGSLSLRAADLVNQNPETVEFACIKPCCLPGKMHLRHEITYKIGKLQFTAKELYDTSVNGSVENQAEETERENQIPVIFDDDASWRPVAEKALKERLERLNQKKDGLEEFHSMAAQSCINAFQKDMDKEIQIILVEDSQWAVLQDSEATMGKAVEHPQVWAHLEQVRKERENPEMCNWEEKDDEKNDGDKGETKALPERRQKRQDRGNTSTRKRNRGNAAQKVVKLFLYSKRHSDGVPNFTLRVMLLQEQNSKSESAETSETGDQATNSIEWKQLFVPRRLLDSTYILLRNESCNDVATAEVIVQYPTCRVQQSSHAMSGVGLNAESFSVEPHDPQQHLQFLPPSLLNKIQEVSDASGERWEGRARFKKWCDYVEDSIRKNDDHYVSANYVAAGRSTDIVALPTSERCEPVSDSTISHETIMVAPQYFQNRFVFVERDPRLEKERWYDDDYTNHLLTPAYQNKPAWQKKMAEQKAMRMAQCAG